jgi:hypothetical protein
MKHGPALHGIYAGDKMKLIKGSQEYVELKTLLSRVLG